MLLSVGELVDDSRLDGDNMTRCGRKVGGKQYFVPVEMALGSLSQVKSAKSEFILQMHLWLFSSHYCP